jgi:hypothetical protein
MPANQRIGSPGEVWARIDLGAPPDIQGITFLLRQSGSGWEVLNKSNYSSGVFCQDRAKYGIPQDAWSQIKPAGTGSC